MAAWAAHLRKSYPTLIFSGAEDGSKAHQNALGVTAALELFGEWAKQKDKDLVVALVGTTNVSSTSYRDNHSIISRKGRKELHRQRIVTKASLSCLQTLKQTH